MQRHHVIVDGIDFIGKEANRLDDVEAGLIQSRDEVLEVFTLDEALRPEILLSLKKIRAAELAKHAGISERQIKRIRNGQSRGSRAARRALLRALRELRDDAA